MRPFEFSQSVFALLLVSSNVILIMLLVVQNGYLEKGPTQSFKPQSPMTNEKESLNFEREKRDVPLESSTSGGAMFVRWGRTKCPTDDQLVYAGVAGGTHYTVDGGGANYICLPWDPIFGKVVAGQDNSRGYVYGAEYEMNFDSFSNQNAEAMMDHNVPCAVCRSTTHSSVLMIPARNECYEGWQMEYDGYLVSAYHDTKGKTEYVCMDADPEADPAGYRNENGALFYQVEGVCGSLPCPPYDTGKELTCVVCTK